jgi:hypothetical protein
MEPLSPFSQFGPVRAVAPVAPGGGTPEPARWRVGVQYDNRSDGVEVMTVIDRRTGVVIAQTPAPQVLAVVDSIVAAIRRREV